jgi:hypothetical protein
MNSSSFAEDAEVIAQEAYIYLYPLILMDISRKQLTNLDPKVSQLGGPANTFTHMRAKASPPASGDAIRGGGRREVGIEQITNISCSRGRYDRRPGLPDRIPTALPG